MEISREGIFFFKNNFDFLVNRLVIANICDKKFQIDQDRMQICPAKHKHTLTCQIQFKLKSFFAVALISLRFNINC